ncbi:RNA-directed DNA polymerase, eukaryota [Tanacetum coccineum]
MVRKVMNAAAKLGCMVLKNPFTYLGTKVGDNMARKEAWRDVEAKVLARLSKWKMKTLSIGGRFTLLKAVLGSMPIFHMSIYKVPINVLKSLESIRGVFLMGLELAGVQEKASVVVRLEQKFLTPKTKGVHSLGPEVIRLYMAVMVDGMKVFLVVVGLAGFDKEQSRRGGIEESQLNSLLQIVQSINLVQCADRFRWTLESDGEFSVASVRRVIDQQTFQDLNGKTRWVTCVPIKVNINAWKIKIDALPTRFNLSRRGMDIESIICPVCNTGVETTQHLFFKCSVIRQIVTKILSWWNVEYVEVNTYEEWALWLDSIRMQSNLK